MLSWLIRKRHPSRACILVKVCDALLHLFLARGCPLLALSRSFPGAPFSRGVSSARNAQRSQTFLLAFLRGQPKAHAPVCQVVQEGGLPPLERRSRMMTPISLEQFRHSEGEVSSSQPGTHRGRPFRARSQCQQPEEDNDGVNFFSTVCMPSKGKQCLLLSKLPPLGRGRFLPAETKALLRPTLAAHPVAAGRDDRPRGHAIADCRYRQH